MTWELDKTYDALARLNQWDENSRAVISKRLEEEIGDDERFVYLNQASGRLLTLLCDFLISQPAGAPRVKLAEAIDRRLSDAKSGVLYAGQSWRGPAYRAGLDDLAEVFLSQGGQPIAAASPAEISAFFKLIMDQTLSGLEKNYNFLRRVLLDASFIYYSHPAGWNLIGFPGPAYPEGYGYVACGQAEKWEPQYYETDARS